MRLCAFPVHNGTGAPVGPLSVLRTGRAMAIAKGSTPRQRGDADRLPDEDLDLGRVDRLARQPGEPACVLRLALALEPALPVVDQDALDEAEVDMDALGEDPRDVPGAAATGAS